MSEELKLEGIKFDNILEELGIIVFGNYYEDADGNWYQNDYAQYLEHPEVNLVDRVFDHIEDWSEYLYMRYIFTYKGKYYSIVKNEDSYGDSGWETDSLKEVFPKTVETTVYE